MYSSGTSRLRRPRNSMSISCHIVESSNVPSSRMAASNQALTFLLFLLSSVSFLPRQAGQGLAHHTSRPLSYLLKQTFQFTSAAAIPTADIIAETTAIPSILYRQSERFLVNAPSQRLADTACLMRLSSSMVVRSRLFWCP